MKAALRRLMTMSGVVAAMAWPSQPAYATVTLEAQIVDVTCTVTALDGTTVTPCTSSWSGGSSWAVMLQQGWSAQMVATIDYAYADDGLPLPGRGGWFQMDSGGFSNRFVDHEAGALYAITSNCIHRYCAHPPGEDYSGWSGFPPVFLSDNDEADRLNGTLTVATGASFSPNFPNYPGSWGANIFISLQQSTWSVDGPVGAIPEPSTFVSMLLGLGALASAALRRSRRAVNR
jgi:PEP-CTERM motif